MNHLAITLTTVGVYLASIYVLWILFLAVMSLKRAKDNGTLTVVAKYLGWPIFGLGYLMDFLLNIFPFSLIVADFPEEWTISVHIERLLKEGNSWQQAVCRFICHNLLDAFDPSGNHCGD